MKPNNPYLPSHQAGFTLVEIMVGLVIGMLATAIILQVMTNFEAQKRVTTGSADAQTNGNIALYNIGREMQQAGYPLMPLTSSALECTTVTYGSTGITSISPVTITDGAVSDSITVRYGNSLSGGAMSPVTLLAGNDLTVNTNFGCQTGDTTLIINGTTCALSSASAVPVIGSSGSAVQRTLTLRENTNAATGSNLTCLGTWNEITYAVNNGNLERNGVPTMEGIVNLQAQYGISTAANSNQVTQWVDATGGWAAPTTANRNRIKAVRIAIVARNAKREDVDVTAACSSITNAAPTGLCAWDATSANPVTASPAPAINLVNDADGTRWQRYRYRVFETIMPLRNVIWSRETL